MSKVIKSLVSFDIVFLVGISMFFLIFIKNNYFLYGDFATFFPTGNFFQIKEFSSVWLSSLFLGYDTGLSTLLRLPVYLILDINKFIFGNFQVASFLTFLYFFRYYFLKRFLLYINVNNEVAILLSIFYTFSFYFIDRLGHTYIVLAIGLVPALLELYFRYLKSPKLKYVLGMILCLWVILSSMHVTLMLIYFSFGFAIYLFHKHKNNLKYFLIQNLRLGLWIFGGLSLVMVPTVLNRVFSQQTSLIDLVAQGASNAIFVYSRTSNFPLTSTGMGFFYSELNKYQPIVFFGYIFLLFTFFIIFFNKHKKNSFDYLMMFTAFIFSFIGSHNISKDAIFFMKKNLVGFASIKDSGYFLIFIFLPVITLLAVTLSKNVLSKYTRFFLYFSVIGMISIHIFAIKKFEVFTLYKIPQEYYNVEKYMPDNTERTLILPLGWVSQFDWSDDKIMSGFFNYFLTNRLIVGQNIMEGPAVPTQKKLQTFIECFNINCKDANILMDELNISRVIYFKGAKAYPSNNNATYDEQLKSLQNNLETLEDGKYFNVYKYNSANTRPYIFSENNKVDFSKVDHTKYAINFLGGTSTNLMFLDSFHPSWHLYPSSQFSWWKAPFLKPIAEKNHYIEYGYANAWNLNEEDIERLRESGDYDGARVEGGASTASPDVATGKASLVLYFLPQSYFYYGLLISGVTLIILIVMLAREWWRGR